MDGSRRAFLRGGFLSRQGREEIVRQQRPLGPFPPWLDRVAAGGRCRECSAPCVEACPEKIIRSHDAGHAHAGEPYLIFRDSGCTYCGDCAHACPVQPLRAPEKPVLGSAQLDEQRCLPWQRISCFACRGVCPEQALIFDPHGRPSLDNALCNGCGLCVGRCPVAAITVTTIPLATRAATGEVRGTR